MPALIEAIDVHAHYGAVTDQKMALARRFMTADVDEVIRRARRAHVVISVVSPLAAFMIRSRTDEERANRDAARRVEAHRELRQWVVIDPLNRRISCRWPTLIPACA